MKIPKFLEKAVLNSDNVKAKIEEAKKKSETDTSKRFKSKTNNTIQQRDRKRS